MSETPKKATIVVLGETELANVIKKALTEEGYDVSELEGIPENPDSLGRIGLLKGNSFDVSLPLAPSYEEGGEAYGGLANSLAKKYEAGE